MEILYLCPRWGSESLEPAAFIDQVQEAGYEGIELSVGEPNSAAEQVIDLAKERGLFLVAQHSDVADRELAVHLDRLEQRLRMLASFEPEFVNCHTGRDRFSLEENLRVFDLAAGVAADTGVPVVHETHRGRCCHSAWRTAEVLAARREARLTLDMSHWCCVSESLLEDQADFMEKTVPRVDHLHARVGWAHGPQVSDPRAPEWAGALEAHMKWWDRIVAHRRAGGARRLTICPEFGPVPYLPVLPYTRREVADPWEINLHMMNMLRERYRGHGA